MIESNLKLKILNPIMNFSNPLLPGFFVNLYCQKQANNYKLYLHNIMRKLLLISAAVLAISACSSTPDGPENSAKNMTELKAGWENPPQSARTQVWWHWMNGNITKDGIKKDLEWMHRIGLGGFHNFDAAMGGDPVVKERLVYMHPEWNDAFEYAIRTADSLGLEATIASSPGWSATGGPWVEPQDAMKKYVWRTAYTEGGQVNLTLPAPFESTGAFQNAGAEGRGTAGVAQYYEDIAVIAMKLPQGYKSSAQLGAKVTSSSGNFTLEQLTDQDLQNPGFLATDAKKDAWIQFEYPEAVTIRSITISDGNVSGKTLQSSDDGKTWTTVCPLSGGRLAQATLSVPATTAKFFRVLYAARPAMGGGMGMDNMMGMGAPAPKDPQGNSIAELDLCTYSKANRFEDKAGFAATAHLTTLPTAASEGENFSTPSDVVDVTEFVKDGVLTWTAPEGTWKIFRFGFSLTGKQNHPATAEATGLEVDKLDPIAWTKYFHTYLDMYKKASGGMIGQKGIQYVLNDSYEAEQETWTPAMFEEFSSRRGYDLKSWMPALAGEVLCSPEQTDAFLYDFRQTIGELIADNYSLLTKIAVEDYGMKGRYTEAHEAGRVYPVDGMDVKATAAVPMSAQWVAASWIMDRRNGGYNRTVYMADDKESSSVAHIYGQNVAAAESMTDWGEPAYSDHPGNLKYIADLELAYGITRFVIHESAHQPLDDYSPGFSLGGIGTWFNRHVTWAEMAGTWVDYMSRSSFMLMAGKNAADILYYYGEDSNICTEFGQDPQPVPFGYQWDYCSPNALKDMIVCKNGKLASKSGVEYKVLWMDRNVDYMTVSVLKKLSELAKAGAWIGGAKPKDTPTLVDDKAEWQSLVGEIWGGNYPNVIETTSLQAFLDKAGVAPDVDIEEGYRFLHRTMSDAEVYWINKPSKEYKTVTLSFRTSGRRPELWHPDNGTVEQVSYKVLDGRTEVTLPLVPDDAVFVVFSGKGQESETVAPKTENTLVTVETPWTVKFQEKRGAPAEATFETLKSYTESDEFGIKYFSGVASYLNTINVAGVGSKTVIDLGNVHELAEVYVNGQYCGTAWKEPFKVDVTSAIKEGENSIEVKVANNWCNRLIGDKQPNCPEVIGHYDAETAYNAASPIYEAGLIGPVRVLDIK